MNTISVNSDRLENVLAQASGLSMLLYGGGYKGFQGLSETDQDNVLWLLSDLVCEANGIVNGSVGRE